MDAKVRVASRESEELIVPIKCKVRQLQRRLYEAVFGHLRSTRLREGFVVRNLDGSARRDGQTCQAIERICRRAGLPVRYWHTRRQAYGTHAALFGVNPWRLQAWLGHKRIDETMLYVHVAENHRRDVPESIVAAGRNETDPDRRILKMLSARGSGLGHSEQKSRNYVNLDRARDVNLD